MTIPSRPAPAPPGPHAQSAAAGANASIEQLRLQLQQQQRLQQQNGLQKITIKLPPPPKGSNTSSSVVLPLQKRNTNIPNENNTSSAITRKFPPARYSPATNWDDSPFDGFSNGNNSKKVPPPRPPPPKVNGRKPNAPPPPPPLNNQQHSHNIISSIFNRKKDTKAPIPKRNSASTVEQRVYGLSSRGSYSSTSTISSSTTTSTNYARTQTNSTTDWNAVWNTTGNMTTTIQHTTTTQQSNGEPQLISFDSPPSSPTFTQKSNSDCLSVDSFSSDSNFSSPNNGSVSQPESGFEDDFGAHGTSNARSRPMTASPLDPWEAFDAFGTTDINNAATASNIGTAPVRNATAAYHSLRNNQSQSTNDNPLCNGKSLLPPPPSLAMPTIIKPKVSQKPKAPKPPVLPKPSGFPNTSILDSDLPTPPSPPMPKGAPPPLSSAISSSSNNGVSLIDVISGKVDALALNRGTSGYMEEPQKPYGIALYDFDGAEEGDLTFRENEKIYLLEQVSEEWYRGRTRAGCEGIFPGNYIEIKEPLPSTSILSAQSTNQQAQNPNEGNEYQSLPSVRCLYDFPADVAGDLELKENDYITIHYRINEDWLFGECNGRQGQFPANFLEYLPDDLPYMP